ncbi:solute carrier family 25 protein [Phyllosticta citribraziliensis]|uniref:Solute carrier family 25 protein n=1 Tax=Phyllosticta citribraziliensis TaxID=989973 RepID=A0ABR1LCP2_9PEZI
MSADFWAGYLSGAAGILIGNPLDLVKTRLQAGPAAPTTAAGTTPSFANWHSASNFVRGIPAPVLGYGALNALLFVSYNRTLLLLGEPDPTSQSSPNALGKVFLAGAVGGVATFVVSAPTELVKCRAQVYDPLSGIAAAGGGAGGGGGGVSSWAVARETWRAEGLRGFYRGGVVTAVRDAVGYAFYFWSYELCKRTFASSSSSSSASSSTPTVEDSPATVLLCGGLAGVVTWASIFPLDVIKTRVQTQPALHRAVAADSLATGLPPPGPRGAWAIAKSAYANEGAAVFFRGLGVCSVRAFVVNAVQWAVYEWVMRVLVPRQGANEGKGGLGEE